MISLPFTPEAYYFQAFPELKYTKQKLVRCVFHEDRTPSLSLCFITGAFHCFGCGSKGGDILQFHRILNGLTFGDALSDLNGSVLSFNQRAGEPGREVKFDQRIADWIESIWSEGKEFTIDCKNAAARYLLKTRKLGSAGLSTIPADIRFHPALSYKALLEGEKETRLLGEFPAMLAAVRDEKGKLVSVHRTFLTHEGQKAPGLSPKQLMPSPVPGITRGAAIRLQAAAAVMGVAEGIETALACQLASGLPVWATVSAGGMEAVSLPEVAQEIVIFGDNDVSGTGQRAAERLAGRLYKEGRQVKIVLPARRGDDWADHLTDLEEPPVWHKVKNSAS